MLSSVLYVDCVELRMILYTSTVNKAYYFTIRLERDGAAFNGEGHCNAAEYNVNTE